MIEETAIVADDTMLYREPVADSPEEAIQDIWGKTIETRVVAASRVPDLIAEGWVTHPMDVGKPASERSTASPTEAVEARLVDAQGLLADAERQIATLTAERDAARADLNAATEARLTVAADLKAAEELADAETKAKDAALAELAALKAQQNPKGGKG